MANGRKIIPKSSRRVSPKESKLLQKSGTVHTNKLKGVDVSAKSKRKKTAGVVKNTVKPTESKISIKAPKKVEAKKPSRHERRAAKMQLKTTRKDKLKKRAGKLKKKADIYAGTKKGERLAKRAKRKEERAKGTRKSAFGTALTKIGRGALGIAAAAGGEGAGLRRGGTKGSAWKRAAHEKKKK